MGGGWELLWGPLRAICVLIGHFAVLSVLIIGFWYTEDLIALLFGQDDPMLWGRMPLNYLFQTVDAVLSLWLSYSAGRTAYWELQKYMNERP